MRKRPKFLEPDEKSSKGNCPAAFFEFPFSFSNILIFFSSLTDALDKSKKKYESRIKHLEQQVLQSLIKGSEDDDITARPLLTLASDSESNKSDD